MKETAGMTIRRVFAVTAVALLLTALVFGTLLYRRTKKMTLSQIRNNALDIARIAAELVDEEAFVTLKTGDENTAAYRTVLDALVRVRDSSDVEYIYTIRYNDYGVPVFCVDADPDEPGMIGEMYSGSPAMTTALAGTPASADEPYRDRWGTHISAYAPLFLDGRPVGAAVVDLNYDRVRAEIRQVSVLIMALYSATLLVVVLLLVYVGRRIQRYELRLRKAQEQADENERVSASFFSPLMSRLHIPHPEPEGPSPAAREVPGRDSLRLRYEAADELSYDEAIRLLGNEDLLKQTLKQFHDDIAEGADEIERLYLEGDYENYAIRVHALKSSARVIGATALSEQARRLEQMADLVREA